MHDYTTDPRVACSFCGSSRADVRHIVLGPVNPVTDQLAATICEECTIIAARAAYDAIGQTNPGDASIFAARLREAVGAT